MTSPTDRPEHDVEMLLRAALSEEASAIRPQGDGLSRIQQRTAGRRARWFGPALATAAVVVVAGGTVAGVLLSSSSPKEEQVAVTHPSPPPHHRQLPPTPVTSSPSTPPPTSSSSGTTVGPATGNYWAVLNDGSGSRVVEVSTTGAVTSTIATTDGSLSDLQLSGTTLYVVDRTASCATSLDSLGDGGLTTVTTSQSGWRITGYAVNGSRYVLDEIACKGAGTQLVATDTATGATNTIATPGNPPGFDNDPAWVSDTQLDVVERTGNEASVVQVNPFSATSWSDTRPACPRLDSASTLPLSLAGAGQNIIVIAQSARGYEADSCGEGVSFGLPGSGTPLSISTATGPSGADNWLTTSTDGTVWDREGSRDAVRVPAPNGVVAVAW